MQYDLTAHKIVLAQSLVAIAAGCTLMLWARPNEALAAFLGGAIGSLASLFFARRVFRYDGTSSPSRILRALYVGEVLKILLTVGLLAGAIVILKVDVMFLLIGYGATLPVYWLALLIPQPSELTVGKDSNE